MDQPIDVPPSFVDDQNCQPQADAVTELNEPHHEGTHDEWVELVQQLRQHMYDAGFRPVPVHNGNATGPSPGKRPKGNDWANDARRDPPLAVTQRPDPKALNTGLLCDGLRCVDIDVDDPEIAARVEEAAIALLGDAPVRQRRGSPRTTRVYRAEFGEPKKLARTGASHGKGHGCKVEVLGLGQQMVAFGDHESGQFLDWRGDRAPGIGVTRNDLTSVTEDQISAFLDAISPIIGVASAKDRKSVV